MGDATWVPSRAAAISVPTTAPRHSVVVRVTHWISTLCFFALLVSGLDIVVSHPRFYWAETGNVGTPALFHFPIPASRSTVHTGYGYVLPDQNGWSRSLHFQAAWAAVLTGLLYAVYGLLTGHFRKHLLPAGSDLKGGGALESDREPSELQAARGSGSLVVQRASATHLPVCDLRFVPLDDLDGPGNVSRLRVGISRRPNGVRRPAIRPHPSFFRHRSSRTLPARPRRDGLPWSHISDAQLTTILRFMAS